MVFVLLVFTGRSLFLAWQGKRQVVQRTTQWSGSRPDKASANEKRSAKKKGAFGARALWILLGLPGARRVEQHEAIYAGTPMFYQRAGIYDATGLGAYQALRYTLVVVPFLLLGLYHLATGAPYNPRLLLAAVFGAGCGYMLPVWWLRLRARWRKNQLNRTFPDAIDLLMVCVQAGMGLDSAINRIGREIHVTSPELAKEFKILSLELKTGKPRNECLRNLAQRTDLPDIDNLVNLLIQADKYGTGVAQALEVHAEDMRQKRYARIEEAAAKLPVKLTIPMILFIFPALFVVIMGPAMIQVFRTFLDK
ncbi:MAG: type II secretion system F family protein [Desulfobulbaceae bacterium]|nr:type II secretion system F family protein [Desulfobulbaceae bacterium]